MDLIGLLWIFFIISALQPVLLRQLLESRRRRAFREIESKRGSRVIGLIHRQETMRLLGFPLARYIDIEDSEQVLRAIHLTDPAVPIDLILHTPGGLVLASEQIADALRQHPAKVTVFVPHYAMSGGTMVALAADEIVMSPNAVLGPVDPQVGQYPAASILTVLERKPVSEIDDQTLILADIAEKAMRQIHETIARLLAKHMGQERAEEVARVLSSGFWTHDYPINAERAAGLGLPVSTDMPVEVFQLMQLYPQTSQRRPTVEYIPVPYRPREREPARRSADD